MEKLEFYWYDELQVFLDKHKWKFLYKGKIELDFIVSNTYTWIETLWLSARTLNSLIMWDILSVEKLRRTQVEELRKLKGFWNKAEKELKEHITYT